MKKTLITISLMLLFINIPAIANAASNTIAPTVVNNAEKGTTISHANVSFNSNGGSARTSLSVEYNGKAITPAVPTKTGYTFGGWYKDNTTFANLFNFTNTAITENVTLFAKWKINSYVVTFNNKGGSAVTSKITNYNSLITVPVTPTKAGYTFGGWYKDARCLNVWGFATNKVTSNITLYSKWIVTAPAVPTGITAKTNGFNSIKVSFKGVNGASGYEIYSAALSKGTYTLLTRGTATSYNNNGLTTSKAYYYKVRAYRVVGSVKVYGGYSNTVSSRPLLVAPLNVMASRINTKSIKVTWGTSPGANGYEVYRATSSSGTYSLVSKTTSSYFVNSGLITGKAYYYKVRSYRTVGKIRAYSGFMIAVSKINTTIVYVNLVQPNPVYGKYAGLKVEIKDESNNRFLIRKPNGTQIWVACKKVSVPTNPATNKKYMSKNQLEIYANTTSNFVSNTNYFTWVDLNRQRVNIFTGSAGHWVLVKSYSCASGNNKTPSKRGLFTIQDKGYSFVAGSRTIVKYWTRYSGNYMLHSIILTNSGRVVDGTIGKRVSHGCIRMPVDMAKWVYDKMPRGSLIWVN
ncbi:InlB B-repeat-containing protein [Clostridium lacusfryxellense]|uniref:InlB B-repeat-containing protein n=1 Tax=Clostridium lacusfryxellense TaxID=205328 RepID=UPI001C0C98BC|nr:InlB B-repeat-containing protein [Clostridium lacusfryxellense]MBU3111037.1 InlB B-repeat-containing protein [Clostridium lacusfryxellense]